MSHSRNCQGKRIRLKIFVVPDLVEGFVYPSRALLVSGFLGAYLLSERTLGDVDESVTERVRTVLTREAPHVRIVGESDVPTLMITACTLGQLGQIQTSERMILSLVRTLSKLNQRPSDNALARSLPRHRTGPFATDWCG